MKRPLARWLLGIGLLSAGCEHSHEPYDHSSEHPTGHDHHERSHGHGDESTTSMTLWGGGFELFAEHPAAVQGHELAFLLHLTVLDAFRPLEVGTVTLELDGPASLQGQTSEAIRPGIFRVAVTPRASGAYRGRLRVDGPNPGVIEGVELRVFADVEAAQASVGEVGDDRELGRIELLKEQEWRVPFGTAFVRRGRVASSIEAAARVQTPPGGTAEIGAPVTGRLVVPRSGLPRPGDRVKRGQLLAQLMPAPSSPELSAQARLAVAEAEARASAAQTALQRAERLIADEAISRKALEDARREAELATASVVAARDATDAYAGASGVSGTGAGGAWRLTSPIAGTVVSVRVTPGATVSPGTTLFRVVDLSELWIVAQVPEQDAARLRTDRAPSYQVAGLDDWTALSVSGATPSARVVTIGKTVDPVSRTVDAIYSLSKPEAALRVGGLLRVSLPAGDDFEGIVIPTSAVVTLEGRSLVYVQVDGEHFRERAVRTGPDAGDRVGVLAGLRAGERIVTRGAHLVRLADRASGQQQAHGHVH